MSKEHGLTLTKSTTTHEVAGRNLSAKRKKCIFKKEFAKFRHDNSHKVKFNQCYDANSLKDYKVELKKAGVSNKVELNVSYLQVFVDCGIDFEQQFQQFFHHLFSY